MRNQSTIYGDYTLEADKIQVLVDALSGFELSYSEPTEEIVQDLKAARRLLEKFASLVIPDLEELYNTALDYPLPFEE